jgi:hypothetical protein
MTVHHFRARLFKSWNRLYVNNGAHLLTYNFVAEIDDEITRIIEDLPWYLKDDNSVGRRNPSPEIANIVSWQHHLFQSCVSVQRVRMFRPFLNPRVGDSWQRCVLASASALSVYKSLRSSGTDLAQFQRSQKPYVAAYQIFSPAVTLATLLLVELPASMDYIRTDIEMVLEDLHAFNESVHHVRRLPLHVDAEKTIRRIQVLYNDRIKGFAPSHGNQGTEGASLHAHSKDSPTTLVPAISSVIGGESTTRWYLERCAIQYIINDNATPDLLHGKRSTGTTGDANKALSYEALVDFQTWEYWDDRLWEGLSSTLLGTQSV